MIKFTNRPVDYIGFIKAVSDRTALINTFQEMNFMFNQALITSACCYPVIDKYGFNKCGLKKVIPRELDILKEDLTNKCSLDKK